jgi:hypothetical protein
MRSIALFRCSALCRSGCLCRRWPLAGKRRCLLHGGASTGARSVDGKRRQAEGREHHIRRLRAQGRKPGPPKGTGGRPRKVTAVPVERLRLSALAAFDDLTRKWRSP